MYDLIFDAAKFTCYILKLYSAFFGASSKNSSSARKRLYNESQSSIREPGETINSDSNSRHNSISYSTSYNSNIKQPKYFNKCKNQKPSKEFTLEKCISKMIIKEIERSKNDKIKENDDMKIDIKKLKEEYSAVCMELNEVKVKLEMLEKETKDDIDRKIESIKHNLKNEIIMELTECIEDRITIEIYDALKQQNNKIENLQNTVEEIVDEKLLQTIHEIDQRNNKNGESINISYSMTENEVEADMNQKFTQKQKQFYKKDDAPIPIFIKPKWLIPKEKCNEIFKFCQKQVANFLFEYFPFLFDLSEIIAPSKKGFNKNKAHLVITHFWKDSLSIDLIKKENQKESAAQRNKISRKIYLNLKNSDGIITSNKDVKIECHWHNEKRKCVPKSDNFDNNNICSRMKWQQQRPKEELQQERYEKGKNYIIIVGAKNDNDCLNQTRICKIDFFDSDI
uniref:Uncharacterized protein n=1 Tax=Panagrolaimus sp. PS1159 TaxID=55785 RepID=A0AC35FHY5_9BILA